METDFLKGAIADLDEPKILQLLGELENSESLDLIINDVIMSIQEGMSEVGNRFEKGDYFIAELVFAAEISNRVMAVLRPRIKKLDIPKKGKVVIGTAKGDVHDIGKNIVRDMLEATGFEIYDLGVNVPAVKFVDKIREVNPEIVGISGLLTLAIESVKSTIEAIKEAGLREQVKIIIGGNPMTKPIATLVGADEATRSAAEGVEICKKWVEG